MGDLICLENIKKEIDMTLQKKNATDFRTPAKTRTTTTTLSDGDSPASSTTSSYSCTQDETNIRRNSSNHHGDGDEDDDDSLKCLGNKKCVCTSSTNNCQYRNSRFNTVDVDDGGAHLLHHAVRSTTTERYVVSPHHHLHQHHNHHQLYVEHLSNGAVGEVVVPLNDYRTTESSTTSSSVALYNDHRMNCRFNNVKMATKDSTFLTDRCLEIALKIEEKRARTDCTYFATVQKDITPPMRKIVAEWMMEVCAEEKCQEEVVLLALNYMDRFLSEESIRKTHLQILGAACLLLASKLREPTCQALSAELLVFYTDNSIYKDDLIKWELIVLSRLGWDMSAITPLDFLELLLIRLPIRCTKYFDFNVKKVRQHAQAFISLAAKECNFSKYSASTIAASSIVAALSGLIVQFRNGQNLRYLLSILTDLTSIEQDFLFDCMLQMEKTFDEHSRNLQPSNDAIEHSQHSQQQQQQVSLTTVWQPLENNDYLYDQNRNSSHSKNRNQQQQQHQHQQQYDNSNDKTVQVLQYSI